MTISSILDIIEGYISSFEDSAQYYTLELVRRVIDMDRIFYLREKGYRTAITRLSEKELVLPNGQTIKSSPLRDAIVGKITQ